MTSVALHIDQAFSPAPGGIGTYLRELAPRLATEVHLTLFHARFPGAAGEAWMDDLRRRELRGRPRILYPTWVTTGRPALPADLASMDVLHAPLPAAIPPPGPMQRLVVTVHDLAFRRFPRLFPVPWLALYRLGTRRAVRHADAIIVPSESTKRDLVRLERADPNQVHVVPLAASSPVSGAEEGTTRRLKVPRPYVLFVGTLEPRKNLPRLIRAYRHAMAGRDASHALVLAGPLGWRADPLLRVLRAPGPGEVVLTGRASPQELDALYREADLFLYPSLYEGFGLPVLEAMAREVAVVTSNVSSLPEVADDAAVLVDPLSVEDLATAIRRLLDDPDKRARLGEAGRARAASFSWDRTASETLDVYRRVVEG